MGLSDRLQAVADLVSPGSIVCDVGCDHGYVPVYLVEKRICTKVIAMDVNEGPLMRAREHIRALALEEYIETRLSDGVSALGYQEADSLILAGMGGRLTVRILSEGWRKAAEMREVILQPQSDIGSVRAFLRRQKFVIVQEDMVYEDGKYYPLMKAAAAETPAEEAAGSREGGAYDPRIRQQAYDRYGPCLLADRHPVLFEFLQWEQERESAIAQRILAQAGAAAPAARQRLEELRRSAAVREFALSYY